MTRLDERIDAMRLTPYHVAIFAVGTLILLIDGFDAAALAYAAPALSAELNFAASSLGPVFSAHLVGMVVGSPLFGMLADRRGRRPTIIISALIFTVFTALTAFESDFKLFLIYRFMTGIGLGGAAGNAIAICSEFAPRKVRTTVVSIVYSAFPLGSVLGGYLAVWLISDFGWRSIFLVGAGAGIPALALLTACFPESVVFLRAIGGSRYRIEIILRKLGMPRPEVLEIRDSGELSGEERELSNSVSMLFTNGMWRQTIPLWVTFFANQMVVYFLFMWMPTVMKAWGLSVSTGIIASASQNLGGVIGAFSIARIIDKRGPFRVLVIVYLLAFALSSAVGSAASEGSMAIIGTVAVCGFFLNGANVNLAGLAADLYPTLMRSTGVGWSMGIGRAGGIAGSMIGGILLTSTLPLPLLYPLAALPLVLASAAIWYLSGMSHQSRMNSNSVLLRSQSTTDRTRRFRDS